MKTLVVVAHRTLDKSSTQAFFKEASANLDQVTWHPLVAPFDVEKEQALICAHERIVLQFPLEWYQAPAPLTRWLAEVLTTGFAYANTAHSLAGKSLGLVVNFGQKMSDFDLGGSVGQGFSNLLSPFAALAKRTEMTLMKPLLVPQFDYQSDAEHQRLLVSYQQYLQLVDPERFSSQGDWWRAQLQAKGEDLLAQTLEDKLEELRTLQSTIAEMKAGER